MSAYDCYGDAKLVVGGVYFSVQFADGELSIPVIQTLRYVKRSESLEHGEVALFNDLSDGEELFFFRSADVPDLICGLAGLIEKLADVPK